LSRRIHRDPAFAASLAETVRWLGAHRPAREAERLRHELDLLETRLSAFPRLGREVTVYRDRSVRVLRLGRLPYLVWYVVDPAMRGPVTLVFFAHEKQDRRKLGLP
jgi:plasmid stabilization system protein ParE